MNRVLVIAVLVLMIVGCSSKPIYVGYSAPEPTSSDWFPIPSDAPALVTVESPVVSRIQPYIEAPSADETASELTVEWLLDSVGNSTLLLNRQAGTAWELVEVAINRLEIRLYDKNRDEYRFELATGKPRKGLLALFRAKQNLNIVLIPRGNFTVIAVEGKDEVLPESSKIESILKDLAKQLLVTD